MALQNAALFNIRSSASNSVVPDRSLLPLGKHLEDIISTVLAAYNSREHSAIRDVLTRYFSPDFQLVGVWSGGEVLYITREALADMMVAGRKNEPSHRIEEYNITALVDEDCSRAKVFTTTLVREVNDLSSDFTRETIIVYYFETDPLGLWKCYRFESLRGPGHGLFA